MYMGKVVGNIVSTRIDNIGAGIGDRVLVTTGSGARLALNNPKTAVDAVVVGIIDE